MSNVRKDRKLGLPYTTSGSRFTSNPNPNAPKDTTDSCSGFTLGLVPGRGPTLNAVPRSRPGLNLSTAHLASSNSKNQGEGNRGLTPTQASTAGRLDMERLPDLGRLGNQNVQVHQPAVGSMSELRPTSRSVSRPSVNLLPLQLQDFVTEAGTTPGRRVTPTARSVRNRPQTYAELFRTDPMNPNAQEIISEMDQIADCHRLHLQVSLTLERLDPSQMPQFVDTLKTLEGIMRNSQDHIRDLERTAGLAKTPRVI